MVLEGVFEVLTVERGKELTRSFRGRGEPAIEHFGFQDGVGTDLVIGLSTNGTAQTWPSTGTTTFGLVNVVTMPDTRSGTAERSGPVSTTWCVLPAGPTSGRGTTSSRGKEALMSTTRIQLALNVDDVDEATEFYTRLFGVGPHKQRAGYANFVVADPPLKLVLIENPGAGGGLNHLGVEAETPGQVDEALARFTAAGLATRVAEQDVCCHAAQHKVFVEAPEVPLGFWEFYTVTDDDPANPEGSSTSVCELTCAAGDTEQVSCCA